MKRITVDLANHDKYVGRWVLIISTSDPPGVAAATLPHLYDMQRQGATLMRNDEEDGSWTDWVRISDAILAMECIRDGEMGSLAYMLDIAPAYATLEEAQA